MVGTPSAQQNLELGRPEGDLRGELPGHVRTSLEPLGSQKLSIEVWGNPSWVHPALLPAVQRAAERRRCQRHRGLPV